MARTVPERMRWDFPLSLLGRTSCSHSQMENVISCPNFKQQEACTQKPIHLLKGSDCVITFKPIGNIFKKNKKQQQPKKPLASGEATSQ